MSESSGSDVMADPPVRPGTTAHTFKAQRDEARADAERLRDHLAAYSQQAIDAEAEVERLQRIVDSVQSKTALDVVAEKLQAQDDLRKALAEVERLRDANENLRHALELRRAEVERLRELLRWALPYVPEPTPSMEGGEFAERYHEAKRESNGPRFDPSGDSERSG